jgi:SAM-dependent methyltransferase
MAVREGISRIVSHPRVFKVQTALLGGRRLAETLQPIATHATQGRASGTVVDVGGGTASGRSLWPDGWTYISVDPDERVAELDTHGDAIQRVVGDASKLAFDDDSVDVVMMKNVSHHLDDETWPSALTEVRRILKSDGYFVFVDALWSQRRLVSRLAWSLDAGRFPRVSERLEGDIARSFDVESVKRLTLVHHCIMVTSRPRSATSLLYPDQPGT